MTSFKFGIEITTSPKKFEKLVLDAMAQDIAKAVRKAVPLIEKDLQSKLPRIFLDTDVYLSLVNGPLDKHFGIPQGEALSRLDQIINTLASSLTVNYKTVKSRGKSITGGFTVTALKSDFSDVLSLGAGKVLTEKGETLPWLEWLLIRGDEIIIADYGIDFQPGRGRSGGAVMVKNTSNFWKVPIAVSGTQQNNWITRAVRDSNDFLDKLITRSAQIRIERSF